MPLCKVNPLQARRFAQANGTRARTDAIDAAMPALVAMTKTPDLNAQYDRMREAGKRQKPALTTRMRKLIQLANTLIRDDTPWHPKPA